ncbi:uncharacterized protein P174DRAFT_221843 [Aspergillus novofumigatus IBT 16806]|uniref:Uncharacterized protein n=1 Tax=Aspergillus novofumigatus (strain IBT 16806) TaxID=1392255 RepID=A0A2I1C660_ASPN1|nr:uncharacterized protein P174DRAFT_221843 [Aspergillus novofumigatus IBT 16806]PKX93122.1 hypothetical protein P174DRAFT_221843 [Aspergillus novofumigatus IBT 16806]
MMLLIWLSRLWSRPLSSFTSSCFESSVPSCLLCWDQTMTSFSDLCPWCMQRSIEWMPGSIWQRDILPGQDASKGVDVKLRWTGRWIGHRGRNPSCTYIYMYLHKVNFQQAYQVFDIILSMSAEPQELLLLCDNTRFVQPTKIMALAMYLHTGWQ